jgi:hypothetical protein
MTIVLIAQLRAASSKENVQSLHLKGSVTFACQRYLCIPVTFPLVHVAEGGLLAVAVHEHVVVPPAAPHDLVISTVSSGDKFNELE